MDLWRYMERGGKRAVAVWHRRAGKDSLALNWTAVAAHMRVGVYWHMLPTQRQARKVVWDGIDSSQRRIIDQVFPPSIRTGSNSTEMKIELSCGSIWQLCGSDSYDALMGANPVGVVFSEWSLAVPQAWDYVRPILAENGGWALFIYTPRGMNHGYDMYHIGKTTPGWFCQALDADMTQAISPGAIDDDRKAGMSEEMIQQEYYCSFVAPNQGSYYGKYLVGLENDGQIRRVPWEPLLPVHTAWDLGMDDSTAIWFIQEVAGEIHVIDYLEDCGEGLEFYAKALRALPYTYGDHYLPHDVMVRGLGTGKTRKETLESLGISPITVVKALAVEDGINAVRGILPKCWFDEEKCGHGLKALKLYQKEYDEAHSVYKSRPLHDWSSHAADAFRYYAVGRDNVAALGNMESNRPRKTVNHTAGRY